MDESNVTTDEEMEGTEEVESQEPEAETQEAEEKPEAKQSDEMKIVIILKGENVMLGVQSPDCDPVYTTMKGTLAAALKKLPKLVEEAKQKWDSNPRYPKADLPTPPPAPAPARTPSAPKPKPAQPSFF